MAQTAQADRTGGGRLDIVGADTKMLPAFSSSPYPRTSSPGKCREWAAGYTLEGRRRAKFSKNTNSTIRNTGVAMR